MVASSTRKAGDAPRCARARAGPRAATTRQLASATERARIWQKIIGIPRFFVHAVEPALELCYRCVRSAAHESPSSRGPGRGPFKAKTRVRIPVGTLLFVEVGSPAISRTIL